MKVILKNNKIGTLVKDVSIIFDDGDGYSYKVPANDILKEYIERNKTTDMNEIRRLQKAAREKNISHLIDWLKQFDDQVRQEYENAFQKEVSEAIDNFCVAIAYALHFSEKTKFGEKRIKEFLDDTFVTVDMFRKGEYNPEDYKKQLAESGITIFDKKGE